MLKSIRLTQNEWLAVAGAACATGYLLFMMARLVSEIQAERQTYIADLVSTRHNALCSQLGKPPGGTDHEACMNALLGLKEWHRSVFLEEDGTLL